MKISSGFIIFLLACAFPSSGYSLTAREVFRSASPSVVAIDVKNNSGRKIGYGSGVVVDDQIVLTNCHVLKLGSQYVVHSAGHKYFGIFILRNDKIDLCVLKVSNLSARPVKLRLSDQLGVGERIYAIGNPRGLDLTLSEGLISSIRPVDGSKFIQISAPISPGSSGGGVFDEDGNLVGISTFSLRDSQNLNFAMPIDWAVSMAQRVTARSEAMRIALSAATSDRTPPEPKFASADEASKWIAAMQLRLPSTAKPFENNHVEFLKTVHYEATRAGLDPQIVLALIQVSSNFKKYAIDSSGARGYMRVPTHWVRLISDGDERKLFEMRTNIRMGCPLRQNSCRLDNIHKPGAAMKEGNGTIRTGIQG